MKDPRFAALALALASGFFLTLYSFIYQGIREDIARPSVLILRGVVQGFGLLAFAWSSGAKLGISYADDDDKKNDTPAHRRDRYWRLLVVSLVGGFRLSFIFAALMLAKMTTVHTMLNGTPVVVMLLSAAMLKKADKFTCNKALASVMLIGGVLLGSDLDDIVDTNPDFKTLMGLIFALSAMFFSAVGSVLTKTISMNFDKKVISSSIGFSILAVTGATVWLDDFLAARLESPEFNALQNNISAALASRAELAPTLGDVDAGCVLNAMLGNGTLDDDAILAKVGTMCVSSATPSANLTLEDVATDLTAYSTFLANLSPLTRVTCVEEIFPKASALFGVGSVNATTAYLTENCMRPQPPYFPTKPHVWFYALLVAFLGTLQQFCLIGKPISDVI